MWLRGLGIIYGIAFFSLWSQVRGLLGSRGILPVNFLIREYSDLPIRYRLYYFPSLFWLASSDRVLSLAAGAGVVVSLVLIMGIAPLPCLILLWILYLSFVSVGQDFMAFQWDSLLLETGFLAIFVATPLGQPMIVLLWWLLFRLLFESGVVKLSCGDKSWRNLTALNHHFFTQPLPTALAWYFHHLPATFRKVSVAMVYALEIILPFLIFLPGPGRDIACYGSIFLQLVILLTGNYNFFNLLTILLSLSLLDQQPTWAAIVSLPPGWREFYFLWAVLTLLVTLPQIIRAAYPNFRTPKWLRKIEIFFQPLRLLNSFGLFRVMTLRRPEISVEGSWDGKEWKEYEFRYKPGDLRRRPAWVQPHHPRLDWQMWFAALDHFEGTPWFRSLLACLLEGSPEVLQLLKANPFPEGPPRQVRAVLYEYEFTSREDKRKTGAWWKRKKLSAYSPTLELSQSVD